MSAVIQFHWQLDAYRLSVVAAMDIFERSKLFPSEEKYSLTDQIRRSSRSVAAQIAEGWRKRKYEASFVNKLNDAVDFAKSAESHWPKSMYMPDRQFVMTYDSGEKAPDNEVLGPVTPTGGSAGIVYQGDKKLAEWGDVDHADMTFSVAKSYLALLAGLALGDGLIKSLDDKVARMLD